MTDDGVEPFFPYWKRASSDLYLRQSTAHCMTAAFFMTIPRYFSDRSGPVKGFRGICSGYALRYSTSLDRPDGHKESAI